MKALYVLFFFLPLRLSLLYGEEEEKGKGQMKTPDTDRASIRSTAARPPFSSSSHSSFPPKTYRGSPPLSPLPFLILCIVVLHSTVSSTHPTLLLPWRWLENTGGKERQRKEVPPELIDCCAVRPPVRRLLHRENAQNKLKLHLVKHVVFRRFAPV